jgi:hypothetical protein
MKLRTPTLAAAAAALAAVAFSPTASASLVYDETLFFSGQGFGAVPRDLTLQATGQDTFESGAVGVGADGGITFGTPITNAQVFMGNGVSTQSGTTTMPEPLADNQKYGIPTTGSLGITSANQIAVLFNADEPSGNGINLQDLTLKFYSSSGTFLGAIDGQQNFASTLTGNGSAGFSFVIDQAQQSQVNQWLATGGSGTKLALEATLADASFAGGPESFVIYNLGGTVAPIPEPQTYALMLAGLGVIGFMARRRNKY